ncbi:LysR family transcriptional regulator [Aeromicrobium sp. CTD01-1L150]|uniref:LysR family transcriptional regulator n=1 Tax=Aeromicrobium sp. CTD01-1L150 TaxID=3341830 RepID=UPI0035C0A1BC
MRDDSLPDVTRLRLLDDVARFGSIASAARANGITASAVSQQLSLLEREAGARLLERQRRGVALTGAGRVLVEKAGQVVRLLEETRTEMDQLKGELAGRVRVGAIASAAMSIVLPSADRVRTEHPDIDVRVSVVEPSASLEDVASGALDVAVIDIYDHVPLALPDHLEVVQILKEPLVLVTADGADRTRRLADLKNTPWVMPPASAACGQAVRHACRAEGFEPDVTWETDDLLLLVESVAQGHGVTLLPRLAVARNLAPVRLHELGGRGLHRRILSVARTSNAQRPIISSVLDALHTAVR